MGRLDNKRVLIAGGTGSVGHYLVRAHLKAGATVIVPSRSQAKLDALAVAVAMALEPHERARLHTVVGNITSMDEAPRILRFAGPLDGAIASLGEFVEAPSSILDVPEAELQRVIDSFVLAHFAAARAVLPALRQRAGVYVLLNGALAYSASYPGAGLVRVATAAQAMLARVLREDEAHRGVRIEELVLYSNIGRGHDDENPVTGHDIGRFATQLIAKPVSALSGGSIHLRTTDGVPTDD